MRRKTEAKKGKPWTPAEQAGAVIAYNAMLAAEQAGQTYSKAAISRYLRGGWPAAEYEGEPRPQFDKDQAQASALGLPPVTQRILHARSRASVDMKLMNISACRDALGLPLLTGYKPAGNYQQSLLDAVKGQAAARRAGFGRAAPQQAADPELDELRRDLPDYLDDSPDDHVEYNEGGEPLGYL